MIAALQARGGPSAIDGIDRSATAVARARRRNSGAIERGKAHLLHGDFLRDAPQSRYDQAFAVNVNVFWRDPGTAFAAASVWVKRKGSLLLIFEAPGPAKAVEITDALQRADASPFELRRCQSHPDNSRLAAFWFTHASHPPRTLSS